MPWRLLRPQTEGITSSRRPIGRRWRPLAAQVRTSGPGVAAVRVCGNTYLPEIRNFVYTAVRSNRNRPLRLVMSIVLMRAFLWRLRAQRTATTMPIRPQVRPPSWLSHTQTR